MLPVRKTEGPSTSGLAIGLKMTHLPLKVGFDITRAQKIEILRNVQTEDGEVV
jgi:hypothetical protein